jgi:RNA polymerase sigma-70 factor (ECF subfamily)
VSGKDRRDAPSDEQLLAEFLDGNDRAFESLVRRYTEELYFFVARFVGSRATAEDVVQETFIQVHQSAGGFDASRRFKPWLFTIAANKARDLLRSRGRKREVSIESARPAAEDEGQSLLTFLSDPGHQPGTSLEEAEEAEVVREVVSRMPDNLREVLVLGYYHRLPYKEIAEVLNIPLGTVKSRLHAAVAHFAAAYRSRTEP